MVSKSDMIAKGKRKYVASINAIGGAEAYRTCGAKGGMDTAVCLKGLKAALTVENWASAWETSMA
jgi:hypothetical protein